MKRFIELTAKFNSTKLALVAPIWWSRGIILLILSYIPSDSNSECF